MPQNQQLYLQIQGEGDFKALIEYINQHQLWKDIIHVNQHNRKYYFIVFIDGKQQYFDVSSQQLQQYQEGLILQSDNQIYIMYLLLYRAVQGCRRQLTKMMNRIFAYPIQSYSLQIPTQCFEILKKIFNLTESNNESTKLYGFNRSTKRYDSLLFQPSKFEINNLSMKIFPHFYSKIVLIHQQPNLHNSRIYLKHYKNHYVIINITIISQGMYYFNVSQQQPIKQLNSYKLCLLNGQSIQSYKTIYDQESLQIYLEEGEYTLYLASMQQQGDSSFIFWVQSLGQYSLQLRYLPQYNIYTQKIIKTYLKQKVKQIIAPKKQSLIRCKLSILGFCVDIFNIEDRQIQIQYQNQILCDQKYRKKKIRAVKNLEQQYIYIYLNRYSEIKQLNKQLSISIIYL